MSVSLTLIPKTTGFQVGTTKVFFREDATHEVGAYSTLPPWAVFGVEIPLSVDPTVQYFIAHTRFGTYIIPRVDLNPTAPVRFMEWSTNSGAFGNMSMTGGAWNKHRHFKVLITWDSHPSLYDEFGENPLFETRGTHWLTMAEVGDLLIGEIGAFALNKHTGELVWRYRPMDPGIGRVRYPTNPTTISNRGVPTVAINRDYIVGTVGFDTRHFVLNTVTGEQLFLGNLDPANQWSQAGNIAIYPLRATNEFLLVPAGSFGHARVLSIINNTVNVTMHPSSGVSVSGSFVFNGWAGGPVHGVYLLDHNTGEYYFYNNPNMMLTKFSSTHQALWHRVFTTRQDYMSKAGTKLFSVSSFGGDINVIDDTSGITIDTVNCGKFPRDRVANVKFPTKIYSEQDNFITFYTNYAVSWRGYGFLVTVLNITTHEISYIHEFIPSLQVSFAGVLQSSTSNTYIDRLSEFGFNRNYIYNITASSVEYQEVEFARNVWNYTRPYIMVSSEGRSYISDPLGCNIIVSCPENERWRINSGSQSPALQKDVWYVNKNDPWYFGDLPGSLFTITQLALRSTRSIHNSDMTGRYIPIARSVVLDTQDGNMDSLAVLLNRYSEHTPPRVTNITNFDNSHLLMTDERDYWFLNKSMGTFQSAFDTTALRRISSTPTGIVFGSGFTKVGFAVLSNNTPVAVYMRGDAAAGGEIGLAIHIERHLWQEHSMPLSPMGLPLLSRHTYWLIHNDVFYAVNIPPTGNLVCYSFNFETLTWSHHHTRPTLAPTTAYGRTGLMGVPTLANLNNNMGSSTYHNGVLYTESTIEYDVKTGNLTEVPLASHSAYLQNSSLRFNVGSGIMHPEIRSVMFVRNNCLFRVFLVPHLVHVRALENILRPPI